MRKAINSLAMFMVLSLFSHAEAYQLVLSPSNVIGSSGNYNDSSLTGQFGAANILDTQTGPTQDTRTGGSSNYWIEGGSSGYVTIDLGAAYVINSIDLFNTHNYIYNNFSTNAFSVSAGNSLAAGPNSPEIGSGSNVIASGNLTQSSSSSQYIVPDSFSSIDQANLYRYIQFNALSYFSGDIGIGLNELRVFVSSAPTSSASVNEPASVTMIGLPLLMVIGLTLRRFRKIT